MGKTAVVILEYNNVADTVNCVDSVRKHNSAPIKFIVIDNGSTKSGVVDELDAYFASHFDNYRLLRDGDELTEAVLPELTYLVSPTNDGYANGNNKARALVNADPEIDKVLILNSDILFVEDILPALSKGLELPGAAIVCPVLFKKGLKEVDGNCSRRPLSSNEVISMFFPYPYDPLRVTERRRKRFEIGRGFVPIDLPSGSCMLLRKDTFERLGWFDPGTFLYFEEDILYEKIHALGMRNYLDTDTKCIHLGATTTKSSPSGFVFKSGMNSAQYFLAKYRRLTWMQRLVLKAFVALSDFKYKIKGKLGA